jgi:hypothetical protein
VKEDREGFYLCQADNGIGTGLGKVVQVKVNCKLTVGASCRCETVQRKIMNGKFQRNKSLVAENMVLKRTPILYCNLFYVFMFQASLQFNQIVLT